MDKKKPYRIVASGKKAERRDYSKVSGKLELPNLVEIQTDSFEWFKTQGIAEVFNEIYPIQNYGGNIRLKFLGYEFEEPKYSAEDSMYRECNYAAPLKAKMELEITDTNTGEVMRKEEEVFLGRFPADDGNRHIYYQRSGTCHRFADRAFSGRLLFHRIRGEDRQDERTAAS